MNPRQIRQQAINTSTSWWFCENLVNHPEEVGLLRMDFPRVFILVRDRDDLYCSFETFRDSIAEINFMTPSEREEADTEAILIDAWNFMCLQEEEEERLYEENYGYEEV